MKPGRSAIHRQTYALPTLRFEDQQLTSFSGLVIFQRLFEHLRLKNRVRDCFRHLRVGPISGHASIVMLLIIHASAGSVTLLRHDPLVGRLLGLKRLPDVATVSRALSTIDNKSVNNLRALLRTMVLDRVQALGLRRLTLDFDGSVIGACRSAEGTAVGFNKKKKGQRCSLTTWPGNYR